MFKRHRYPRIVILQAVYFKLRFTLSFRDVEELMQIRGVHVDHSTIQIDNDNIKLQSDDFT